MTESPVPENSEILTSESVEGSSLSLQGVDHIHSGDSLPLGMLAVCHSIPNDVLQENLQDTSGLLVDQTTDSLDTSPPSAAANKDAPIWTRDSLEWRISQVALSLDSFQRATSHWLTSLRISDTVYKAQDSIKFKSINLLNVQQQVSPTDMSTPTKKAAPKKPAEHPLYKEMIAAAISSLANRSGSSKIAISKYISANYKVGDRHESQLKLALLRGLKSGALVKKTGLGCAGSFKLAAVEKKPAAKKPAAKKAAAKKPAAKKPAAKKAGTPKKKVAAKSPKKKTAAAKKTTPKKKPTAAKKKPAAKKATPKKAKK
eukprot:sb/3466972/